MAGDHARDPFLEIRKRAPAECVRGIPPLQDTQGWSTRRKNTRSLDFARDDRSWEMTTRKAPPKRSLDGAPSRSDFRIRFDLVWCWFTVEEVVHHDDVSAVVIRARRRVACDDSYSGNTSVAEDNADEGQVSVAW